MNAFESPYRAPDQSAMNKQKAVLEARSQRKQEKQQSRESFVRPELAFLQGYAKLGQKFLDYVKDQKTFRTFPEANLPSFTSSLPLETWASLIKDVYSLHDDKIRAIAGEDCDPFAIKQVIENLTREELQAILMHQKLIKPKKPLKN